MIRGLLAVAMTVPLAIACAAAAAGDGAIRKALTAEYGKMDNAVRQRDVKSLMARYAPDYTGRSASGKLITRAQEEARWRQNLAQLQSVETIWTVIDSLRARGKSATAVARFKVRLTLRDAKGEIGPKGKIHRLDDSGRERDTWIQSEHGWLLRHSDELPGERVLIDGKVFNPRASKKKQT